MTILWRSTARTTGITRPSSLIVTIRVALFRHLAQTVPNMQKRTAYAVRFKCHKHVKSRELEIFITYQFPGIVIQHINGK